MVYSGACAFRSPLQPSLSGKAEEAPVIPSSRRLALQTRTAARAHIAVALPCPNGLRRQTAVTGGCPTTASGPPPHCGGEAFGTTSNEVQNRPHPSRPFGPRHLPQRGRLDFNCSSVPCLPLWGRWIGEAETEEVPGRSLPSHLGAEGLASYTSVRWHLRSK